MEDQSFATKIANHIIFCARTRENRVHSNQIIIFISKLTYLKYYPLVAIVKRDIWFLRYSSLFFLGVTGISARTFYPHPHVHSFILNVGRNSGLSNILDFTRAQGRTEGERVGRYAPCFWNLLMFIVLRPPLRPPALGTSVRPCSCDNIHTVIIFYIMIALITIIFICYSLFNTGILLINRQP